MAGMKTYYIATKLENYKQHNEVRDRLYGAGVLTYDWTVHGPVYSHGLARIQEVAVAERRGVVESHLLIALLPGGRGTHAELGMALAKGIPTMLFSTVGAHFVAGSETCAFYHDPSVIGHYLCLDKLINDAKEFLLHE